MILLIVSLEESIQFVLEEIGCAESNIEFKTMSSLISSWMRGDLQVDWEMRLTRNLFLNKKSWVSNLVVTQCMKAKFQWFNLWCSLVAKSEIRSVHNGLWNSLLSILEMSTGDTLVTPSRGAAVAHFYVFCLV